MLFILLFLPSLLVVVEFIWFAFTEKRLYHIVLRRILEVAVMVIFPLIYFSFDEDTNDCCSAISATFSPDHTLTFYTVVVLCLFAYFYSTFKTSIFSPIVEVITNSILLLGLVLNIFIAIHVMPPLGIAFNVPIIMLFIFQLVQNHKAFLEYSEAHLEKSTNQFEAIAWKILNLSLFFKFPLLLILCLPLLVILMSFLMLFGQKPHSLIRVFTHTYKHGLSQLDYLCDDVHCGDHFLCSVATKGHPTVVKPIRYGERGGHRIICNRQLLVANAFEELVEQKMPGIHKIIRHNYNKVGNLIHRYYYVFNNKFIADTIYYLMKPLEVFFLFMLYTFDQKPENRIAKQYLSKIHKKQLEL